MPGTVGLIATYDTKGTEAEFIKTRILRKEVGCVTLNTGVGGHPIGKPDVSLAELCRFAGVEADEIQALPRGEAVKAVSMALDKYVQQMFAEKAITCLAGIGGAGGTQIATQAMRQLPFGFPKFVLTTLASGNTRWYLESSDITLVPSIVDVAGINRISHISFERFAVLAAEAAQWYAQRGAALHTELHPLTPERLTVAQTMYGTTTPGVSKVSEILRTKGFEPIVFHASGAGGMAMENFIVTGVIQGVIDMTLAEIGAYLVGGLHTAGPHRLEAAGKVGIPQVIIPGAADTIVLPPKDQIPEKFQHRTLNVHNPTMTTMRTNIAENQAIAAMISERLLRSMGPVKVILPKGGLSSIDRPGQIFYDPEANEALFATLHSQLQGKIEVIEDQRHINDPGFATMAAEVCVQLMNAFYAQ